MALDDRALEALDSYESEGLRGVRKEQLSRYASRKDMIRAALMCGWGLTGGVAGAPAGFLASGIVAGLGAKAGHEAGEMIRQWSVEGELHRVLEEDGVVNTFYGSVWKELVEDGLEGHQGFQSLNPVQRDGLRLDRMVYLMQEGKDTSKVEEELESRCSTYPAIHLKRKYSVEGKAFTH